MRAISAERNASTKQVIGIQTDIDVLATGITGTNGAHQTGTTKIAIRECNQMHRTCTTDGSL